MSSATITSKKSLFDTFPAKYHHAGQDEPEEQKPSETPEEKPAEQKAMWKPGGFTPARAGWNTVQGRIKSYFA